MEAKNKIYKRSWRDHDGWMERKIGPTSRPLIEPTWNRSLGSGMNLGPLFAKLQLKDQRVWKLGIIYIMVVLVACSALPIEVMLGWIVLNIGILCFLLECFRVRSEHCEDLTNKTFYEGNWEKNSQADVKGEISKNESKKKIPQKESYDLSTEQVNQIKSREKTYETWHGSRAITFPDSSDSDEGEQVEVYNGPRGGITFEDSESLVDEEEIPELYVPNEFSIDLKQLLAMETRKITVFLVSFEGSTKVVRIPLGSMVGMMKEELTKRGVWIAKDTKFI